MLPKNTVMAFYHRQNVIAAVRRGTSKFEAQKNEQKHLGLAFGSGFVRGVAKFFERLAKGMDALAAQWRESRADFAPALEDAVGPTGAKQALVDGVDGGVNLGVVHGGDAAAAKNAAQPETFSTDETKPGRSDP
jgi:hypothetical protein